jgi:hypothetical protein
MFVGGGGLGTQNHSANFSIRLGLLPNFDTCVAQEDGIYTKCKNLPAV